MSRNIDLDHTLTEDEVKYLQDRDDPRLLEAKLPGDTEPDVNPDVRGTPAEGGLDEIRPDEDEPKTPEEAAKAESEEKPKARAKRS